jgi:hypothetical protein
VFFALALLIGSTASAQEAKGWLVADVLDVTKAEADTLKWDAPHGAKVGVVATGSPADKAGLKTGDIVVSIDNMEPETAADFDKTILTKSPLHRRAPAGAVGWQRAAHHRDAWRAPEGASGAGWAAPHARHGRAHGDHQWSCLHAGR